MRKAGWGRLLALAVLVAPMTQAADVMDETRARGALRIAVEGTYPPFNFKDPKTGHLTGYDVEVARLLAARLNLRPEFVFTEWSAILPAITTGKVDAAISQVIITPGREEEVDFSVPYTYSQFQFIVRNNERVEYHDLDDFKGRKVGVSQGSVFEDEAMAVPGIDVRRYPAIPENLQDLAFGRIDASLDDSLMVSYLLKNAELPIKAGPLVGDMARIGVAFRKGNPTFKAALDKALGEARADGSLRRLSIKWFGIDASGSAPAADNEG